jgi:urease accessory protein
MRLVDRQWRRCRLPKSRWWSIGLFAAALLWLWPRIVAAHVESSRAGDGGLVSGLLHPVSGIDHVVAMVAVGLWGAQLGAPAIWVLPIAFPLVMAAGGVLGVTGFALPQVETGIALSGLLLGLMVAFKVRPPLWVALPLVAIFAVFHGHAHGTALPDFGVPILYASGFVAATGALHLCGIVIGAANRWPAGDRLIRVGGGLVAAVGGYFLFRQLGAG